MADGPVKVPIGRSGPIGRGSLMDMMRRNMTEASKVLSRPTPSPTPSVGSSAPSLGRGRASLLDQIRNSSEQSTPNSTNGSSSSVTSRGRAALLDMAKGMHPSPGSSSQVSPPPGFSQVRHPHSSQNGFSQAGSALTNGSVTHSEPVSRSGERGTLVHLQANYIRLNVKQGRGVYEYEVKFSPDIDSRPLRIKLLAQHSIAIGQGGARVFDGVTLFLPQSLSKPTTEFQSTHPSDGSTIRLSIIFKKQRRLGEVVYLYNVLFRRIMHALNLVQIGRQHFNPNAAAAVPQHKLELWPGFVTAIDEYEGGLQLCLESTHRVLRTQTVRDLMYEVAQRQGAGGRYQDTVINELLGVSVLTRYNNKIYKINDIDWNENPLHEFFMEKDPSRKLSLVQYYRSHWNIEIKDKEQPLLIHIVTKKRSNGERYEEQIYLIPELCYLSGLTESMRQDYKVMKDVATVTRITPQDRVDVARRFVEEIKTNEAASGLLANWGLSLEDEIVALKGRKLDPEAICFGNGKVLPGEKNPNADWSNVVSRMPVQSTPNLSNWCLLYCKKDYRIADDFHRTLEQVGQSMGMRISAPNFVELRDDRTETFLKMLRNNITPEMEMMVIIFPTNRNDRYAAVKKLCCVEMPIASQVIIGRTLSRPDRIKSITEKIALQINCKLGGTLWALKMPVNNCMVCGIDVHHAGGRQKQHGSVAGFVASLNQSFTRWFSKVCLQGPRQELIDALKICFLAALKTYHKVNNRFPDRIIIYRDGVGDGQLKSVTDYEIQQLESAFSLIAPDYQPRLSVVIVQKRINTRIFRQCGRRLDNPAPGTVVDHTITRRDYYDFFLISQNVRQGTVSPTHYLVVHDKAELSPDQLQRLTYQLCHLYYNWAGTVRVPAPCQYAHRLAFLVGQSVQMEPDPSLSTKLYYL